MADQTWTALQSQIDVLNKQALQDRMATLEAKIAALEAKLTAIGRDLDATLIPPAATQGASKGSGGN